MRIDKISQPSFREVIRTDIDSVIVASGYESRARHVAQLLAKENGNVNCRRIAWGFEEKSTNSVRRKNDGVLQSLGFEIKPVSGSSTEKAEAEFRNELTYGSERTVRILVDMSSMTRTWYGAIVRALSLAKRECRVITDFVYVPARWQGRPANYPPNEILAPVKGFSSRTMPDKPTALVIGLGHYRDRAIGLHAHLDPQMTLLFYAKPGADRRFEREVLTANHQLLAATPPDHIFTYPLKDSVSTFKTLESIVRGLLRDWRPVLCSTGPKLFSLMCFLLASYYSEISVWRVSAGAREGEVDHKPGAEPIVFEVEWKS